jgi:O-antigen/teichoic acid export membrane protein
MYRFSFKAWPASASTSALQHADRLILGYFVSPAHLGIYTLVYSLFERLLMVGAQYEDMMVASASRNREEEGQRVLRVLYGQGLQAALFWILPGVMVGGLYAGVGLSIFGETFVGGSQALVILLMGLPFDAMARISLGAMAGMNRPGMRTILIVLGALVNVGLNLLWIPAYGIVGAAWANTLATLLTAALCGRWLLQGGLAGGIDWRSMRQVLGKALCLGVGLVCIKTLLAPWLWLQLVLTAAWTGVYYRWGRE